MEVNKKREAELQRLRRELDEFSLQSETLAASLRKRHGEVVAELSEQCEALQRNRVKLEKEKQNLRMEVDDLAASVNSLQKAKSKQAVGSSLSLARQECEVLREQLEEEQESKQEMQRLVSKLNSELTHWKTKHEADAIQHADELEETKCVVLILAVFTLSVMLCLDSIMYDPPIMQVFYRKKLAARLQEAEEVVEATQAKCSSLEKTKQRLQGEVDELCMDLEKASSCGQALDKKQRVLEKQLGDWKQKCEELMAEVEGCQKESRQHAAELFKVKTAHEECLEQMEAVRRENKAFQGKNDTR
ncbi:hypothetical protein GOODEAATRI_018738 [Goodea atripinnis]|uniref:Myosin tail domain-containing protein n=1 Tax=Goodea atripinnis TaxID=208336 RepID=A0ABV0PPR1_9TELE